MSPVPSIEKVNGCVVNVQVSCLHGKHTLLPLFQGFNVSMSKLQGLKLVQVVQLLWYQFPEDVSSQVLVSLLSQIVDWKVMVDTVEGGWGPQLPIPDVRVVSFKLFRCKLNMFLSHWTWYLSSRGRDPPFKIFECVHCTALSGKLLHSQKLVEEMIERYKIVHSVKFAHNISHNNIQTHDHHSRS